MVELAYAKICRQQWILEYFGEPNAQTCGSCDICIGTGEGDRRNLDEDEHLIVRKALSGVARMSRKNANGWEGIFGRGRVVQMLVGSKSQDILRCNLEKLTTYGILKNEGTAFINALFRSLLDAGLIIIQKKEYPLITLTSRGEDVMKGSANYQLAWPEKKKSSPTKDGDVAIEDFDFDQELFKKLKEVRDSIAKKDNVPAYVVFSNVTLEYITRLKPKSEEQALRIRGIGQVKAEKYLDLFLRVIKNHELGL